MSATTQTLSEAPSLPNENEPENLTKDKIFHILQTQRRRHALRYLKEHDNPVEMRDLAEQVAAWENDTTVQALASDERQRVYIALYQSHLPKLDSEGIIEYNKSRGIVERDDLADEFDPYLEPSIESETSETEIDIESDNDRWFSYYRWATAVSAGTFAAAWLNAPLVSAASTNLLGAFVVGLYAMISAMQIALR
ncbi:MULTISPECIES: hypothetical protein [unclassified Haladaptatus]|uniref:DUF7344 domain-containing protein n=1 Tax=unclassified Haladaptatus TaxID=2622732 RepID=UPI00209BDB47|nr:MULTISPECIES: hypothetical protein [unclassified Haladaptatus]MCO8247058.1 hypothetical protein [Haladaptatus sp. AB643]MCO8256674.1 hypothetical protein [Haladaptatus sp. AB618]